MAIDFSQVKSLTIPEGEVTKITDSSNNVLWQKITKSWHTIWEGNITNDGTSILKEVAKLNALSGTVKLRVTWSSTVSGGDSSMTTTYWNNTGWNNTTTIKPDSPFQFDLDTASDKYDILGCKRTDNQGYGRSCYLRWVSTNKSFELVNNTSAYGDGGVNISMTVTKIEQYY